MRQITIGNTPLMKITKEDVLEIIIIEGCCPHMSCWSKPDIVNFDNTMFSRCVVLDHTSTRINDGLLSDLLVFYLDCQDLTFHWHKENNTDRFYIKRIGLESIKFLLKKGYDIPIY